MIAITKAVTVTTEELTAFDGINVPQKAHFFPDTYKRAKKGISYPPHRLFEKCMTKEIVDFVKDNPVKGKTGFIMSVGSQVWGHVSNRHSQKNEFLDYETKIPFVTMTQIYCGRIAGQFGAIDHVSTDASACASSLKVMMDVKNLIENYGFDRVIVAAAEDAVSNSQLNIFGEAGVSVSIEMEEKGLLPSAFDGKNLGFRLGQGVGIAVFERENDGMTDPLGLLHGAFTSSEHADNAIGQRLDGQGFTAAIKGALFNAKAQPDEVKIIKTHGTGTELNNASETAGITGAGLSEFIATSYKPRIGHTMGASGLIETVMLLKHMRETGQVPGILNRTEVDTKFISQNTDAPEGLILSLAAGMGNVYSAGIFEPV
jgi:3-oxoacyl-(acyl-carrier-protein) synthase